MLIPTPFVAGGGQISKQVIAGHKEIPSSIGIHYFQFNILYFSSFILITKHLKIHNNKTKMVLETVEILKLRFLSSTVAFNELN